MDTENLTLTPTPPIISESMRRCLMFNYYIAIASAVFAVLCVLGNGLTLPTFARQGKRLGPTPTIFLFQAMAVADLLVIIPFTIVSVYPEICRVTTELSGFCRTFHHQYLPFLITYFWPLGPMGQVSSVWITVAVTYHRYRAVCTPFVIHNSSVKPMTLAYVHVVAIWIFSVTYNLSRFWEFYIIPDVDQYNNTRYLLVHSTLFENYWYQLIFKSITHLILINIIPLVIISVLTYRLVVALRESAHAQRGMTSSVRVTSCRAQKDRSLTVTLIGIIVIFFICQIPTTVNRIATTFFGAAPECGYGWLWYWISVSNLLININSSVNFFVYTSCSSSFRHHLRMTVTCGNGSCCGKEIVSGNTTEYVNGGNSRYGSRRESQIVSSNMNYKIPAVYDCTDNTDREELEDSTPSSSGVDNMGMEMEEGDVTNKDMGDVTDAADDVIKVHDDVTIDTIISNIQVRALCETVDVTDFSLSGLDHSETQNDANRLNNDVNRNNNDVCPALDDISVHDGAKHIDAKQSIAKSLMDKTGSANGRNIQEEDSESIEDNDIVIGSHLVTNNAEGGGLLDQRRSVISNEVDEEENEAAADNARPAVQVHQAAADNARPAVQVHQAAADNARPAVQVHQAREVDKPHSATVSTRL